ncbi:bifunctional UDP-N-acetylmuramoyl-tripeptide:D-alanyl-D-alanine ligase/alanine racemase [Apibacter muscae]|uniref:Alanine racemase n=1 Tax=Apibacter muscae TaxID=2509004 RepID=A0A563DI93_9FLAO|nr:bifunctional UDP-N-acetylmuramoyl-tripeptide:D-alanyl-D-alanine ligase/alanine racemase [Apibacter muscae]TWP29915.1 bifunctional UDP-N-acetylmuramoyl-tripeptide:D-alanyl-D-alanine ligase/alanine racemase [Apibacter muscae]
MEMYTVGELASLTNGKVIGDSNKKISEIFYDSRSIVSPKEGIFFALTGNSNGHDYIEEVFTKSIRIFVCSYIPVKHEQATYILVDNPLEALQKWAKEHLKKHPVKTIGITGSNGKTIVKEWLFHALNSELKVYRSTKSYNSQLGLAISILQMKPGYDLGIFEVGISYPGEMEKQEKVLSPKIGVLTNVLEAHSANFKDKEDLIVEKIKLFKHSEAILCNDQPKIRTIIKQVYPDKKIIFFGKDADSDIQLLNVVKQNKSTCLNVKINSKEESFTIPFSDEASIQNALCLLAILFYLNMDVALIKKKFLQLYGISMRLELIHGDNDSVVINDTFNSDIKSLEIALQQLYQQNKPKKILILSDILQSSSKEEELWNQVSTLVNAYPLDQLLLIGEKGAKYKQWFKHATYIFSTTQEVITFIKKSPPKDSAILLKGARDFGLERISKFLQSQSHDTILEVNLNALRFNVKYFKSLLKPKTKMIAMVKASSYGIGGYEVAETLQLHHMDYLAVAYSDEGVFLRKKGIYLPIMVMNPELNSYQAIIDNDLEPEVYSFRVLEKFTERLKELSIAKKYPIHIKIDTGMCRLGFNPQEIEKLAFQLKENPWIEVKSIFTHLAVSDVPEEKDFTQRQAKLLTSAYDQLVETLGYKPMLHCCNSAGIVNYPEFHFDAVRLGIGMYGYIDHKETLKNLENVVTLQTVISNIHTIQEGGTVSYGRRFRAKKTTRIATLPIGYADGIKRLAGNGRGYVRVNGAIAPIVGSICMDMMMVDVTEILCQEGDEVIVLGESPSLLEYATWCETIPYEILTSISPRVKRIFYKE